MNEQRFATRVLGLVKRRQDLFGRDYFFFHGGAKKIKSDLDGLFSTLLFVSGADDLSFFIGKERKRNGTRYMRMLVLTGASYIQNWMRSR
jgi:hypothetical protein